jgi:hypothetical protein
LRGHGLSPSGIGQVGFMNAGSSRHFSKAVSVVICERL